MIGWIEFLELALQGFSIMFKFIIKILLIIPYIISFIFVKIFRIPKVFSKIKMSKERKNINIDEFKEIEDWKLQEENEQLRLEHEYTVLENTFRESLIDKNNDGSVIDDIYNMNTNMAQVKKDLYNFKVLDSVDIKKQKVAEGAKVKEIRENNGKFDIELFKNWSMQIFKLIKLGNSTELEVIKKVMIHQLFENFIDQMKRFEKDGLQYVTEDLMIKDVSLYDYAKAMYKEEIKILVNARMKEFIIVKDTGKIIRGTDKKAYDKKIIMTFLKQNVEDREGFITNCPNCGAETSQVEFGKCAYCDTLIFPIRYNWTLTNFETI